MDVDFSQSQSQTTLVHTYKKNEANYLIPQQEFGLVHQQKGTKGDEQFTKRNAQTAITSFAIYEETASECMSDDDTPDIKTFEKFISLELNEGKCVENSWFFLIECLIILNNRSTFGRCLNLYKFEFGKV